MTDLPFVSVGVCTYQRPRLLQQTLFSLSRQVTNFGFEVLVVDNDCRRSAESIVSDCQAVFAAKKRDLRYAVEKRRNISLARNKVVALARGDLVAFIDDDERADSDWLEELCAVLLETKADAAFGPAMRIVPDHFPKWMKSDAIFEHSVAPDRMMLRPSLRVFFGSTDNCCFRRGLLEIRKGPFDTTYGLTGGEDSELFCFLQSRGARLVWCARAKVREEVQTNRREWKWHIARAYRIGWTYAKIRFDHDRAFVGPIVRSGVGAVAGLLRYAAQCYRGRVAFLILLRDLARQMGRVGYFFGLRVTPYGSGPERRCRARVSAGPSLAERFRFALGRLLGHCRLRFKGKCAVVRLLGMHHARPPMPFSVPFYGHSYDGCLQDEIDWFVYFHGAWAHDQIALLVNLARFEAKRRAGPVVLWDVGANVGHHALALSGFVNEIHAFEPYAHVRRQMETKLSVNRVSNVTVYPLGLGNRDCELDFFVPDPSDTGKGSFAIAPKGSRDKVKLRIAPGDQFMRENGLPPPTILKVDVEGFEENVFAGLQQCFLEYRPIILSELLPEGRAGFRGAAAFRRCFYEDHRIYEVGMSRWGERYVLRPFKFGTTSDYLVVPEEKADNLLDHLSGSRKESVSP